ncbi:uncharacterized protein B0I36DRAFT_355159 [Microdochium trichocladiopsis]|uniref:Xylanolytic transcriptional activator regulatory domain-containing protein n=1 Tax=Microdochium trichocladiopsis TaxID=1682393 RepID=A0A9P8XWD8_9PEZI|nr:uncharacterized protein B0I36DRAFT_356060 [Microdochium trichocladiopsis]XP_046005979.1 uncharacterized protein B0I36DRAFT_355159 [Microdochium trichocladiopsis]KAH7012682.1 hypothetical protein B0I36DRAFT_356060 [Microdochium trichocladiopsis]KAH7016355.1 hypothetical protein B0I36DRAFT_355159 [Microdochium trichocladiopsis]
MARHRTSFLADIVPHDVMSGFRFVDPHIHPISQIFNESNTKSLNTAEAGLPELTASIKGVILLTAKSDQASESRRETDALRHLELSAEGLIRRASPVASTETPETRYGPAGNEQSNDPSPAECSNAEDYEFDESQDFDNTTDGMGSLVTEPGKVGYTGPQSGVAALKFLQTLHLYTPSDHPRPIPLDEPDTRSTSQASSADISHYVNDYFNIYHTSYPILHEGTFRARLSGAFVGGTDTSNNDVPFYKIARQSLTMDILEKGSLSYVQGLILRSNYLQKRNKPNSGFVLIGIGWSMALAIGLHREFGLPSSGPFTMEIRRRVWWTLFVFVPGAQLTLGNLRR